MRIEELAGDLRLSVVVPPTAAGTALEVPIVMCPVAYKITAVRFVPSAAITANATNFVTLSVRNRGSNGGGAKIAATRAYSGGAGAGNSAANVAEPLALSNTEADLLAQVDDVLTVAFVHTGTGLAIPAGLVQVLARHR